MHTRMSCSRAGSPASIRNMNKFCQYAVRHAFATSISVSLTFGDHTVNRRVEDDGRGFVPKKETLRGFGLDGMHAGRHPVVEASGGAAL